MAVHSHPYLDARGSPQIASTRNHSSTRFWASRHTHSLPHLSTLAHKVLGTQTTDGLPRFRQSLGDHDFLWAVRHYSGHPQNWEPTHTPGHPKPTIVGHPHIIVEAHELLWVAMRYYGRPQDFLSVHEIVLAVHEKSWTLIRDIWTSSVYRSALPRVTGGLTRYLHGHTRDFMGVHGCTRWTTTRNIMRIHQRYIGRPQYCVGTHHACLVAHEKIGASCVLLGYHVNYLGLPRVASWMRMSRTLAPMHIHDTHCGRA